MEGLVSLSVILMIVAIFFPLMFLVIQKQEEGKQDVTAASVLYEKIEEYLIKDKMTDQVFIIEGIQYLIRLSYLDDYSWKVCVNYAYKQKCVKGEYQSEGLHLNRMSSIITNSFHDSFFFSTYY